MATFTDMFQSGGQKITDAFGNPWVQLGMQLMAAGGQMPQGTTTGQRLAQAGQGFMQQRSQQQELDQQKMLRQYQMAQLQRQQQQAQQEAETRRIVQEKVKSDPTMLAQYPLARAVLESTGDYSGIKDLTEIGPKGPGAPKMPWQYQQFDPQGNATQYTYDPSTGGYQTGATYRPYQQQGVDIRQQAQQQGRQQWETEQQFKERQQADLQGYRGAQVDQGERRVGVAELQAQAAAKRAATAERQAATSAAKEARESETAVRGRKVERVQLQSNYRAAQANINDVVSKVDTLLNHPGLAGNFGIRGNYLPEVKGGDAADARALIEQVREIAGFAELNRLKQQGVNLAPVTEAERDAAAKAALQLDKAQGVEGARAALQKFREVLVRTSGEATTTFNQLDSLYNDGGTAATGAPAVGSVEDGYEYMGGDPANPNSWRKR